jgi:crotonobetainyl-CoA:carnitine CoA-transferase CaiB-like acyl-CoA transferase
MSGGPLDGVRVIDMTTVVVGPICTRTLADQGADVVKIEAPGGDILRTMAHGSRNTGMSGKFINFNRNKRAVCLDLKHSQGREAALKLIEGADVFVSNVRPAALERAGLGVDALSSLNSRLIYCSIVAFGAEGRYYNRPAYDPIIQSLSGVAATLEHATGEPRFVPMVMTDHVTGLIAAQCIGFALYRREKSGEGEHVEVPMFENMASFVTSEHLGAATFEPPIGEYGDGRLLDPNYRPLPTRDGFITAGPNTNAQAFAFFQAIGKPELIDDERFNSPAARTAHAAEYFEVRADGLLHKTTAEWLGILESLDIPAAPYNRLEDLVDDPHLKDVGFFDIEAHPSEGDIKRTRVPNTFSRGMRQEPLSAPRQGQHTVQILREAGYSDAYIDGLIQSGAIRTDIPNSRNP